MWTTLYDFMIMIIIELLIVKLCYYVDQNKPNFFLNMTKLWI